MARTWDCPFFRWEDKLEIHCEGATLDFQDAEVRNAYIDCHCANVPGWSWCTIARQLYKQYERLEKDHAEC